MTMELAKRYKYFLLLLAVNMLVLLLWPTVGISSLEITWDNIKEMLAVIPPIFILLGLLDVWVERETMMKYTGRGSGLKGLFISFMLGSAAAGPLYAAFPVGALMLKKGSSLFNVFIFIGAWATTKIPLLTFEIASLGFEFTMIRLVVNIAGVIFVAWLIDRFFAPAKENKAAEISAASK